LFSCTNSEDTAADAFKAHLTIITSVGGLGDMGYNDQILSGTMHFYEANDISMNLIRPNDTEEIRQVLQKWQTEAKNYEKSLLVLTGSEYENVLAESNVQLEDNQQILVFETKNQNLPKGVSSFYINRYGASYLAGCMAKEHEAAAIIAAMPGSPTLEEAIAGFSDAYRTHSQQEAKVIYLAEDESGFNMADKAYQTMSDIYNAFIFPLAGGSNIGIYKYSRETSFYLPLVVGMDADQSMQSSRIPFSMVIHIDQVVEQYLSDWLNGIPLEKYQTFGLESGMIDISLSPVFYQNMEIWEDYYEDDNYWKNAYQSHKTEAIGKEEAYEKN
jgi:basic membrane protein A